MRENLELSRGVVFSGTCCSSWPGAGVSREQAYEWVQRNAMRSSPEGRDFRALLLADADLTAVLPVGRARPRCSTSIHQLRHVDEIFQRVFDEATT